MSLGDMRVLTTRNVPTVIRYLATVLIWRRCLCRHSLLRPQATLYRWFRRLTRPELRPVSRQSFQLWCPPASGFLRVCRRRLVHP